MGDVSGTKRVFDGRGAETGDQPDIAPSPLRRAVLTVVSGAIIGMLGTVLYEGRLPPSLGLLWPGGLLGACVALAAFSLWMWAGEYTRAERLESFRSAYEQLQRETRHSDALLDAVCEFVRGLRARADFGDEHQLNDWMERNLLSAASRCFSTVDPDRVRLAILRLEPAGELYRIVRHANWKHPENWSWPRREGWSRIGDHYDERQFDRSFEFGGGHWIFLALTKGTFSEREWQVLEALANAIEITITQFGQQRRPRKSAAP